MKSKFIKGFIIGFIAGIIFLIIATFSFLSYLSRSLNHLPRGEYLCESTSPGGAYTVKAYVSMPSLSSPSLRCELINNKTQKKRNIYWRYRESSAKITWEDDDTVVINGRKLNLPNDTYDWRRDNTFANGS